MNQPTSPLTFPVFFFSIFLIILTFFLPQARAEYPDLVWVQTTGSATDIPNWGDQGRDVAVDKQGNVYTTGRFAGTVDFDPTSGVDNHSSGGGVSAFITRINSDGSYGWTRTFDGETEGAAIALDQNGWPVVVGRCKGVVDLDAGTGTYIVDSGVFNYGFLVRYNPGGTFDHAFTWNLNGNWLYDVAVDTSGNIYITGDFQLTVDFDPTASPDPRTAVGDTDAFITKIGYYWTYEWTRAFGGTGQDAGQAISVAANAVVLADYFNGTVDFNADAGTEDLHTSNGGSDLFVTWYDFNGYYNWTRTFGSDASDDRINDVVLDSSRNVLATGSFCDPVNFYNGFGTRILTPTGGTGCDAYITKYNVSGTYQWTLQYGDKETSVWGEEGMGLALDDQDNIFMTGTTDPPAGGLPSILTVKFTKDSDYVWSFIAGTDFDISVSRRIALAPSGDFYLAGYFYGDAYFDPQGTTTSATAQGESDIFLARYGLYEQEIQPTSRAAFWNMMLPAILAGTRQP